MALYEIKASYSNSFLGFDFFTPDLTPYEIEKLVLDITHQNGLTFVSYEEPVKGKLVITAKGDK